MNLEANSTANEREKDACSSWRPSISEIEQFFEIALLIPGEVWHHAYDTLACEAVGTIQIDGDEFDFRVNAGAYGFLRREGNSLIYGCPESCPVPFLLYRN